jgi:hypothetical protein
MILTHRAVSDHREIPASSLTEAKGLSRLILFGERSLRRASTEYIAHYHAERNHQGKGNVLLFPQSQPRGLAELSLSSTPWRLASILSPSRFNFDHTTLKPTSENAFGKSRHCRESDGRD